jgi:hypothetical protein
MPTEEKISIIDGCCVASELATYALRFSKLRVSKFPNKIILKFRSPLLHVQQVTLIKLVMVMGLKKEGRG